MNQGQVILLVISSKIDDLGVGFSLGLKNHVPWRVILVIAFLSGGFMAVGLRLGTALAHLLPVEISAYLSAFVFGSFGLWFLREGFRKAKEKQFEGKILRGFKRRFVQQQVKILTAGQRARLGWRGVLGTGLGLSVDSFAFGISGGIAGYPLFATSFLAVFSSILFVWSGSRLGGIKIVQNIIGQRSDFVSCGLMFALAIFQLSF